MEKVYFVLDLVSVLVTENVLVGIENRISKIRNIYFDVL